MRGFLKFFGALAIAFILMMVFRALALTIYTVEGEALSPALKAGDRVLVNRWSYGFRVGGEGCLLGYSRLLQRPVSRGDLVAFNDPRHNECASGGVLICRCAALPGDTVNYNGERLVVPSREQCADADYYWFESINDDNALDSRQLGFVSEHNIIGRAVMIIYNHHPDSALTKGWDTSRIGLSL